MNGFWTFIFVAYTHIIIYLIVLFMFYSIYVDFFVLNLFYIIIILIFMLWYKNQTDELIIDKLLKEIKDYYNNLII